MVLFAPFAFADIPPPPTEKFVDYEVVVTGVRGDAALVVYPWSLSNGVPMAELAEVKDGKAVSFGRRIAGLPAFYAVPRAALDDFAKSKDGEKLVASGVKCNVGPSPRFVVSRRGPDRIVDTFAVTELSTSKCVLSEVSSSDETPKKTPSKKGSGGCSTGPEPHAALWLLLVPLLWRRRG